MNKRMKDLSAVLVFSLMSALPFWTGTAQDDSKITIVYTNDIHSYVGNMLSTDAGNVEGLRLSNIAKMVSDLRAEGENVLLLDVGDEIQGCSYGVYDEGASVIELMNAAGYQYATPGNHEFDYGAERFFELAELAEYPFLSCNFHTIEENGMGDPMESSVVCTVGDKKVAIIGVSTPETLTRSAPVHFQNEKGETIYYVDGMNDPKDLYESVQEAIDEVRDEADIVIALGHVGVGLEEQRRKISSIDIIEHTTGLDAFIDGHSHTTMEKEIIYDMDGKEVPLTQTGAYLNAFGVMEIHADGMITTKCINSYDGRDEKVDALEKSLIDQVNAEFGKKVAEFEVDLSVNNPENPDQRLVRSQELNIGDFVSDAFYWYLNEQANLPCDLVIINGGGIRTSFPVGDVTYNDLKNVFPFSNMIAVIKVTGQQLLDALETGATIAGGWDFEWDCPAENGAFFHVAGMKYSVNSDIPSTVVFDENGRFTSVEGDYRVCDVEIYNRETGIYEPLDLNAEYTVGSFDYITIYGGSGLSMFKECEKVADFVGQDVDLLSAFVENFKKDGEYARVNTASCPLVTYNGYLLDYENPFGAGRISILDKKNEQ